MARLCWRTYYGEHLRLLRRYCLLATERFYRTKSEIFHTHTFAGLTHHNSTPFTTNYEQLMRTALRSGYKNGGIEQIFRLVIFNIVFANCDDHSRNASFIMTVKGEWHFAPAYDLTYSADDYLSENQLNILEKNSYNNKIDNIKYLADIFGIKAYLEIVNKTQDACAVWLPRLLAENGMPQSLVKTIGINVRGITAEVVF